jgi:hypothetical protein
MKRLLLLGISLCALTSWGVSRIGGGKISSLESKFDMNMPAPFADLQQSGNIVIANGPVIVRNGPLEQQFIQIREFKDYYASLASTNRADIEVYFKTRHFQRLNLNPDPCIDAYEFSNESTAGIVATWGDGKGLTMTGPRSDLVITASRQALASLQLQPGACAWK